MRARPALWSSRDRGTSTVDTREGDPTLAKRDRSSLGHLAEADRRELDEIWNVEGRSAASAEGVYRTLREAILSQVLAPTTKLAEEELAGRFGISRTPVREAILRLEAEGLASRTSGRTATVTEISPREIVEIYEVRAVIDGLAAELAATHIEPPAISSLEWINEQMRQAGESGDFPTLMELNLRFHAEIGEASQNIFLRQTMQTVHDRVRRLPGTTFSYGERWKEVLEEHGAIIAALRDHDPEHSFQRARTHMLNSRDIRIAMLESS